MSQNRGLDRTHDLEVIWILAIFETVSVAKITKGEYIFIMTDKDGILIDSNTLVTGGKSQGIREA